MTLDDEETFGNFYKSVPPSMLQESTVVLTEDDLSRIETHTPKSVCTVVEVKVDLLLAVISLYKKKGVDRTCEKVAVLCQVVDFTQLR